MPRVGSVGWVRKAVSDQKTLRRKKLSERERERERTLGLKTWVVRGGVVAARA